MTKLFQQREGNPFHISVGAVPVSAEGKILVHKRTKGNTPPRFEPKLGGLDEAYVLMHESLENGEALEDAVARGLKEEFGVTGVVKRYLGSLQFLHTWKEHAFEKTILYFEAGVTAQGERPMDDDESYTELVWMEPAALLEQMRKQGASSDRPDIAEAKVIEAYLNYGKDS